MTTRADRWAAFLVGLMYVAMCWGVRYVFSRPAPDAVRIVSTDRPHLPQQRRLRWLDPDTDPAGAGH